jgi:glycosyltransferase involved in cell wall biosynthesis
MLNQITPVLLTYNEEQNIGRTLSKLWWAKDIVVVDSFSSDATLTVVDQFENVRLFRRAFDSHADQWRFATGATGIVSDWILRLDADYQLTERFVDELDRLRPEASVSAYSIGFKYAVFTQELRTSLYRANTILLRRGCFSVRNQGHTEVWEVKGSVGSLKEKLIHDDWKSTSQWLVSQERYMTRELRDVERHPRRIVRWLRLRPPLMPIATLVYCLFGKGLLFAGRAGIFYCLQRLVAEAVLALMVLERGLRDQIPKELKSFNDLEDKRPPDLHSKST